MTVNSVPNSKSNVSEKMNDLKESAAQGIQNLRKKVLDTSSELTNFSDTIVTDVQQQPPVQISAQNIIIVTYIISHWVIYNILSQLKPSILTNEKGELLTIRALISSFLLNNIVFALALQSNPALLKTYLDLWK